MEEIKLKAIVLSSIDYKEKDKIINLFSLEQGLISANLRGVRSKAAKLKFASQPFCFGDFVLVKKGATSTVISATAEDNFFELTKDYGAYTKAFTLLEVIKNSLMENQQSPLIFINTLKALKLIAYDKVNPSLVLNKFIVGVLKVLGYKFNFEVCDACNMHFVNKIYLNLHTGAFNCGSCVTPDCKLVSRAEFNLIKMLNNTPIEKLNTLSAPENVINSTLKLLINNFESRTHKKLKTIKN